MHHLQAGKSNKARVVADPASVVFAEGRAAMPVVASALPSATCDLTRMSIVPPSGVRRWCRLWYLYSATC